MKTHYKILLTIFFILTGSYLYFKINDYFDDRIIENNKFYNCEYWSKNYKDIENDDLKSLVNELNVQRIKRVEKILYNLKNYNINLKLDDLDIDHTSTVGRSHIANAMVKKGYFDNYKSATVTEDYNSFVNEFLNNNL